MLLPQTVVERAITLCRNGEVRSWGSLRTRLVREGFDPEVPTLSHSYDRILEAMERAADDSGIEVRGTRGLGGGPKAEQPVGLRRRF